MQLNEKRKRFPTSLTAWKLITSSGQGSFAVFSTSCHDEMICALEKRAAIILSGSDRAKPEHTTSPSACSSKLRNTYTRCCCSTRSDRLSICRERCDWSARRGLPHLPYLACISCGAA